MPVRTAQIVLFALDELRARYGQLARPDTDPRVDTAPFRGFRAALLDVLAKSARGAADVTMWWEGGFDGYSLALAIEPADAVPDIERTVATACPLDAARVAPPRRDRYPLAHIAPGAWDLAHDDGGAVVEAPFGAPTGHFGAPGMRRLT